MPRKPKNFGEYTFMQAMKWYKDNNVPLPKSYKPGGRYYKAWVKYGVDKNNPEITINELRGHGKPAGEWSVITESGQVIERHAANLKEASKLGQYYWEMEQLLAIDAEPDPKTRKKMQTELKQGKHPSTWGAFRKKWKDKKITVVDGSGKKREIKPLADPDKIRELHKKDLLPTREKGKFSARGVSVA